LVRWDCFIHKETIVSLKAGILKAALSLPVFHEDVELVEQKRAQLTAFAEAIEPVSREQRIARPAEWAAAVLATGDAESNFSLRIQAGECRWEKKECDAYLDRKTGERLFRARGPFQNQRYAESDVWWDKLIGVENTEIQVMVASARLERGYYTCRGATDWLSATWLGYAGRGCKQPWPGLTPRLVTWRKLVRVIDNESARVRKESKS
jgi:hypothetical protein